MLYATLLLFLDLKVAKVVAIGDLVGELLHFFALFSLSKGAIIVVPRLTSIIFAVLKHNLLIDLN
jgi:hypothetical protein